MYCIVSFERGTQLTDKQRENLLEGWAGVLGGPLNVKLRKKADPKRFLGYDLDVNTESKLTPGVRIVVGAVSCQGRDLKGQAAPGLAEMVSPVVPAGTPVWVVFHTEEPGPAIEVPLDTQ